MKKKNSGKIFKTTKEKNSNKKKWYKEKADSIKVSHRKIYGDGLSEIVSRYEKELINYDLYNGKIRDYKKFEYLCKPMGVTLETLPARLDNKDIISSKVRALIGMELKMPSSYKIFAVNPEATTRKEEEFFSRIKNYVIAQIVNPIRAKITAEKQAQAMERELTEEEVAQIQQEIEEEVQAQIPTAAKKYMEREYQDPAEVMAQQLLEYLEYKLDLKKIFNEAFKHLVISAKEVVYVGVLNDSPVVWNIDSPNVTAKLSALSPLLEDSEEICVEYRMTKSEILRLFGPNMEEKDKKRLFKDEYWDEETDYFAEYEQYSQLERHGEEGYFSVYHTLWKDGRKIGFLTYMDEDGEERVKQVDESYELNALAGDISIEYEEFPEIYETWVIQNDIYVNCGPLPGQFKNIYDMYTAKMPYYGVFIDGLKAEPTSIIDRGRDYQYLHNIISFRTDMAIASDKGKKILGNINMIPASLGIDLKKWQQMFEATPFMWYNPSEEGISYQDVNTVAKVIDLSMTSSINLYVELMEYIRKQAGIAMGIPDSVEGQAAPQETVGNNRQNLVQSSYILEPYFALHQTFKKNVMTALIEAAKIAYGGKKSVKLSYVLDDMSVKILELDTELLENSHYGLFMVNATQTEEVLQTIKQLVHAAMQNNTVDLSTVFSILRQQSIIESEEIVKVAEKDKQAQMERIENMRGQQAKELEQLKEQAEERQHEREIEIIKIKAEEDRKTQMVKGAMVGYSFNPDLDRDGDGENDFYEIAREGAAADIRGQELTLEREKFQHQKEMDKKELQIKEREAKKKAKTK